MRLDVRRTMTALAILQVTGALIIIAAFFISLWPLELIVSFTRASVVLLFASLAISTVLLIISETYKEKRLSTAMMGLGWILIVYAFTFSLSTMTPVPISGENGKAITFATFNKYYGNARVNDIAPYLANKNVDVVALQETQPEEAQRIAQQLGFDYVFSSRRFATAAGTVTALLSRFPFESAETIELATGHPVVRAVTATPRSGNVVFYSVHLPGPFSRSLYEKRNLVTLSLAEKLQQETLPTVVGGDFNTTSFSPSLRSFNNAVGATLRPVATENWPACSWYGFGSPLCLRIDHMYVPKNTKLKSFVIAPDLGSDHRALIVTMSL